MRITYEELNAGLDQLYALPMLKGESVEDRMNAIEEFVVSNGWDWNLLIDAIIAEGSQPTSFN